MTRACRSLLVLGSIGFTVVACSTTDDARPPASAAERRGEPGGGAAAGSEPRGERIPVTGSDLTRGRATVLVAAPIDRVRGAVLDFNHYADFMPHYQASRLVKKNSDGSRELYMKVEALHGAVSMWARISMSAARKEGDAETYAIRLIDGNVESFEGSWRLRAVDQNSTELTLELLLEPKVPLPVGTINDENASGALDGVTAMRDRVEAGRQPPAG